MVATHLASAGFTTSAAAARHSSCHAAALSHPFGGWGESTGRGTGSARTPSAQVMASSTSGATGSRPWLAPARRRSLIWSSQVPLRRRRVR